MRKLKILNTREVKELLNILNKQFGYSQKPKYTWLISPKNKLYVINNDLSRIDLEKLKIDSIGLYVGEYKKMKFRLSLEGSMIIGPKATKNILELDLTERNQWMKGEDLLKELGKESKFLILKYKKDFLGCGRYKQGRIYNYIPKERRLKVIAN